MGFIGKAIGGITQAVLGTGNGPGDSVAPYMGTQYRDLNSYSSSPYTSSLQSSLNSMPGFSPISAPSSNFKADPYQAKDMSQEKLPQYDAMRERLNSQYSQVQGQAQDSLDRQFAAAGGGPGNGAQAKQTENLSAGIAQQKGQDLLGINAAEAQTRTGLQQQEQERAFQSGEAQKGYGFQASQGDLGRQFGASQFNAQMGMAQNQFMFGAQNSIAGLDMAWKQAQAEANNNEFNKSLAAYQAQHSGGLLGGGGLLGTGFFTG